MAMSKPGVNCLETAENDAVSDKVKTWHLSFVQGMENLIICFIVFCHQLKNFIFENVDIFSSLTECTNYISVSSDIDILSCYTLDLIFVL